MSSDEVFTGSFTQQEPISEEAIEAAVQVLRSGRLHRYNLAPGEIGEVALLEQEFAAWQGARYCLACASGGTAMQLALRAFGVERGERVLTNAFTLAPVPGAIATVGGRPVLVEANDDLVLDLGDLERKAGESGARLLLLSHMRGHQVDMEALRVVLARHGVSLIEDCAHTMGAAWRGRKSGSFGLAACFSTQTYKHLNAGEGGLLTTDDPELMARVVLLSGSYMHYQRHLAGPPPEAYAGVRFAMPNGSMRMDNLRAAILRPQLRELDRNVQRWNARYRTLEAGLAAVDGFRLPKRPAEERFVGSSIQFFAPGLDRAGCEAFVARCRARGVELKWFGAAEPHGFTSRHDSWRYLGRQHLPRTDRILAHLFDMRIPLTFTLADCRRIARILAACHAEVADGLQSAVSSGLEDPGPNRQTSAGRP